MTNTLVNSGSQPTSHRQRFSVASTWRQVSLRMRHRALVYIYYLKLPAPQSPKEDCSSINPVLNAIKRPLRKAVIPLRLRSERDV